MATLKLTQVRSLNRRPQRQRRTMQALGLRHPHDTAEHRDTPQIRGMIAKVQHLITVEEESNDSTTDA
jgi:large subunit ribosomal protein L30